MRLEKYGSIGLYNKMFIYAIHCRSTDKYYVGKTVQRYLNSRWYMHKHAAARESSQMYIHRAMRRHGIENFAIYPICTCATNNDQLSEFEIAFISLLGSNNPKRGYNMTVGGEGTVGRVCSEETKKKIGEANAGRKLTEEQKRDLGDYWKGRKRSDETRRKMSEYWTGKKRKPLSEEHKKQLSAFHKGRKISEEHRLKSALGQIGKKRGPLSLENRLKASSNSPNLRKMPPPASEEWQAKNPKTCRELLQVDPFTGEIIKRWSSLTAASMFYGLSANTSNIRACCANKKNDGGYVKQIAYGFKWRYADAKEMCEV